MWTEVDLDRWVVYLNTARTCGWVEARRLLLQLRNEVGEATITEAQKQKRARYLASRARRRDNGRTETATATNAVVKAEGDGHA